MKLVNTTFTDETKLLNISWELIIADGAFLNFPLDLFSRMMPFQIIRGDLFLRMNKKDFFR